MNIPLSKQMSDAIQKCLDEPDPDFKTIGLRTTSRWADQVTALEFQLATAKAYLQVLQKRNEELLTKRRKLEHDLHLYKDILQPLLLQQIRNLTEGLEDAVRINRELQGQLRANFATKNGVPIAGA
jgi:hypothetical protein